MSFKKGVCKIPHFAHYPDHNVDCKYKDETEDHLGLKDWFLKNTSSKIEVPIGNNIADVVCCDKIIEIQCCPISVEDFYLRCENALVNGKKIVWILGETFYRSILIRGRGKFLRAKLIEKVINDIYGKIFYFRFNLGGMPVFRSVVLGRKKYKKGGGICKTLSFYSESPMGIIDILSEAKLENLNRLVSCVVHDGTE